METMSFFWNAFDEAIKPAVEETAELNLFESNENSVFETVDEEYVMLQSLYRYFAGAVLLARLELDKLDSRFVNEGFLPRREEKLSYYQKYDYMHMNFIYLRSYVHIERLSAENIGLLKKALENRDEAVTTETLKMVDNTLLDVLAVNPEKANVTVEVFPSIDGSGRFKGNSLLLGIGSSADYDENGMLKDKEENYRRINIMCSVKEQLEYICTGILNNNVGVVVEV